METIWLMASAQMSAFFGGVFFIGIFLSIIFMRWERFLSSTTNKSLKAMKIVNALSFCKKIGLDQKQIKQTINKQVLTVSSSHCSLPSYTLSLPIIITQPHPKSNWGARSTMMLTVTLSMYYLPHRLYVIFIVTSNITRLCKCKKRYPRYSSRYFFILEMLKSCQIKSSPW